MTTATRERPKPREAPPTEHVEGEVSGDALIDCDHLDGDASLIRAMEPEFPGYWACVRCGQPFVSGSIVPLASTVVDLYGEWVRGRLSRAPDLMAAVDRLALALPRSPSPYREDGTPVTD